VAKFPITDMTINSGNLSLAIHRWVGTIIIPLMGTGNYSATSINMKLVHWPLMGGLLHLVHRGGDWVGPQPAQALSCCTKCNSPSINSQCTNRRLNATFHTWLPSASIIIRFDVDLSCSKAKSNKLMSDWPIVYVSCCASLLF